MHFTGIGSDDQFSTIRSEDKSDSEFEEVAVPGGGVNTKYEHYVRH